jgi:hypothetical protein
MYNGATYEPRFSLRGSGGNYLRWNGSTLDISGAITVTGGDAATQTYASQSAATALSSALTTVNALAAGTYNIGTTTFITNNFISAPVIAGTAGYIQKLFRVGDDTAASIYLDARNIADGAADNYRRIWIGSGAYGIYGDSNTSFYVDSNNRFSLGDKLTFTGGNLSVSGNITSTGGSIGGWTIDSNSIFSGTKGTNGAYTAAAGSVTISSEGWISSKNFRISSTGAVNADVIDVSDVLASSAYFGTARGNYTIAIDTNAMTLAGYSRFDLGAVAGIVGTYTSFIAFTDGGGTPSGTILSSFGATGLTVNGAITATGNITAYYSDERLKTKLGNITNAIDKISQLNGFYYTNNELANSFGYTDDKTQLGLSAQEVQNVFPNIVSLAPFDMKVYLPNETKTDTPPESKSGENYLTIDYSKLVPVLVEAIKELKAEIEELKRNK